MLLLHGICWIAWNTADWLFVLYNRWDAVTAACPPSRHIARGAFGGR